MRERGMKIVMVYLFSFFVLLLVFIFLFKKLKPALGGNPSKKQKEQYSRLDNYVEGTFTNLEPTKLQMSAADFFSMLKENFSGAKDRNPESQIPVSEIDWNKINGEEDHLSWFGHSAFLVSIDNKKLLVDPMLGPVASPVSFVGSKRYSEDLLHLIDKMPPIDAVFITHDHYDHLDYPSIKKLKDKVHHFFLPLGVGAHLIDWGVKKEKITELDWWDEQEFLGLTVVFTPSKHFSGRGPANRNSTLWGGWAILSEKTRFYTSGDGGYGAHFKEIGKKYGPFDLTLMEGAQYDRRWSWVHMTPEQSVQAHLDVNGKKMMLIHWGAFTLAYHGWTEPIERALKASEKSGVNMITPKIGETIPFDGEFSTPSSSWWK
jgi:L-ascorbate metabolism protein UlaG (beta-lactamase superfamily)